MKVPIGIGDVGMSKIRAQCGDMAFDRPWVAATLLKRTGGKGVAIIPISE
jgi:hypothetical protein